MLFDFLSKLGQRMLLSFLWKPHLVWQRFPWVLNWQGVKMSIDLLTAASAVLLLLSVRAPLHNYVCTHQSIIIGCCSLSLRFLKQNRDRKRSWHCVLLTAATLWDCSPQSEMFAHAGKHRHTKAHTGTHTTGSRKKLSPPPTPITSTFLVTCEMTFTSQVV